MADDSQVLDKQQANTRKISDFLKPTPGRLLVAVDGFHYGGRLLIPETARQKPTTGKVIACGQHMEEWLGKRILFGYMSGTGVHFKGFSDCVMLQEEEILAEITLEDVQLDSRRTYEAM